MRMKPTVALAAIAVTTAAIAGIDLAPIDASADRNPSPLKVDMERIGTLRPRSADEMRGSNWTLGCECLDRDFADFDEYKDYIVPLGIKEIRLFAGWAKCEKGPWDHGRACYRRTVLKGANGSEKVEFPPVIAKPEFVVTNGEWVLQGSEYGGVPSNSFETRPGTFEWTGAPLDEPVWVDLLTGDVYEVSPDRQIIHSRGVTFVNLPVCDSPCVLTERKSLELCH